jgi:hypothetical protein
MTNENLIEIIKRIDKLEEAVFGDGKNKMKLASKISLRNIDFSINERAFVKRYAVDKSGPKKFTLLLAYFAKGEVDKNFDLSDIKNHWNKMSAKNMLGKFNMFYPNDAKNRGWIDSKEYGKYNLTNEWNNVL